MTSQLAQVTEQIKLKIKSISEEIELQVVYHQDYFIDVYPVKISYLFTFLCIIFLSFFLNFITFKKG